MILDSIRYTVTRYLQVGAAMTAISGLAALNPLYLLLGKRRRSLELQQPGPHLAGRRGPPARR